MKRLLLIVAVALAATAGTASGDTFVIVPNVVLPSAETQNGPGLSVPENFTSAPSAPDSGAPADYDPAELAREIDAFLAAQGSPMAGTGPVFTRAGLESGIDPRFLVAVAGHESQFGKAAYRPFNPFGWGGMTFDSWDEAIATVAGGLERGYVARGLTTIPRIQERYAPLGADNDPTNLNRHWQDGVSRIYGELGGDAAGEITVAAQRSGAVSADADATISMLDLERLWQGAGAVYGVPWHVLAAINKIESDFGRNMGPSSAGAVGWMQFMPSTWLSWGTDADGDGIANPWQATDAIYSAARYLAAAGAATDIRRAVFAYNHAEWYVNDVLELAATYERGGEEAAADLEDLREGLDGARQDVASANAALEDAVADENALALRHERLLAGANGARLLSDRLELQRRAAQAGAASVDLERRVTKLRTKLRAAEKRLATARDSSQPASFNPGGGLVLGAPTFRGEWVFPVGGGPSLVSVSRDHHDYPAADIAAPAGTPVYALAEASVVQAWPMPEGACGIGATIRTADGQTWTYCHLSYLDPKVAAGAKLAAGDSLGLVGSTGRSTGPHLHLQLQPASSYPQAQDWFASFAGVAFRWQGDDPRAASPSLLTLSVAAPETGS